MRIKNKTEDYRGFVISWQEPPLTSASWTANVTTNDRHLYALMGQSGSKVIDGRTREAMHAGARQYIDGLLGSRGFAAGISGSD